MGEACSTQGEGRDRGFWRENLKKVDQLENQYVGVGNKERMLGNTVL